MARLGASFLPALLETVNYSKLFQCPPGLSGCLATLLPQAARVLHDPRALGHFRVPAQGELCRKHCHRRNNRARHLIGHEGREEEGFEDVGTCGLEVRNAVNRRGDHRWGEADVS